MHLSYGILLLVTVSVLALQACASRPIHSASAYAQLKTQRFCHIFTLPTVDLQGNITYWADECFMEPEGCNPKNAATNWCQYIGFSSAFDFQVYPICMVSTYQSPSIICVTNSHPGFCCNGFSWIQCCP